VREDLRQLFKKYASGTLIFKNKEVLQMSYLPDHLLHREKEIEEIVAALAPVLRREIPPNLFIYGPPGTGKTAAIHIVGSALMDAAEEENVPVDFVYLNTGVDGEANTPYKIFATLSNIFGEPVPHTGLSTSIVLERFVCGLDKSGRLAIIVLDEIDKLKGVDEVLYILSRLNSKLKNSRISLICISNEIKVLQKLDPRTKSSLSFLEIPFHPYNADEIKDILEERAQMAFERGAMDENVIPFCAAYSAKVHGDLRRALNLLKLSGEIAERKGGKKITVEHVKIAIKKMEEGDILSTIRTLPTHSKFILKCILEIGEVSYTGEIYEEYRKTCREYRLKPLTLRRVNDLLNELETLGLISCEIISRGRYGRTRRIFPSIDSDIKERVVSLLEGGI